LAVVEVWQVYVEASGGILVGQEAGVLEFPTED